jgi:hypothetical protein
MERGKTFQAKERSSQLLKKITTATEKSKKEEQQWKKQGRLWACLSRH